MGDCLRCHQRIKAGEQHRPSWDDPNSCELVDIWGRVLGHSAPRARETRRAEEESQ